MIRERGVASRSPTDPLWRIVWRVSDEWGHLSHELRDMRGGPRGTQYSPVASPRLGVTRPLRPAVLAGW